MNHLQEFVNSLLCHQMILSDVDSSKQVNICSLSNSILIIGYPNRFATHVAVLGASTINSLSESYIPNGVDEPDINEPDVAPDQ
jgi:hypothetical protein